MEKLREAIGRARALLADAEAEGLARGDVGRVDDALAAALNALDSSVLHPVEKPEPEPVEVKPEPKHEPKRHAAKKAS